MTRVMHVIARLNVGGAALHVMLLAAHLPAPAYENLLVCGVVGDNEADMGYVAAEKGVPVTIIRELGRELSLIGDLLTLFKLWRLMRRFRPDIVHTNTAKAGFVGRVAARLAGVPVVIHTFHGHVFHGYFSPRKTRFFILLEQLCARLSTRIIAPSAELKRQITDEYHICAPDQVVVIGVGLDLARLAALPRHIGTFRAEHGIPAEVPLVGIVGRLVAIKNHDLFLQAAAQVVRYVNVHFVLIGDGERRAELMAQVAALGLSKRVTFAGWITDVAPVYSAIDVLVLSSINEGVPISVIEAMAAGVPVVATGVGGVPDLMPDARYGAVVPLNDLTAMADAILAAIHESAHDPDMARQWVLSRYDMSVLAAQTAALYQDLL